MGLILACGAAPRALDFSLTEEEIAPDRSGGASGPTFCPAEQGSRETSEML